MKTIWFNKSFSSIYNVIKIIKENDIKSEYRILCTHENPEFVGFEVSDLYEIESSLHGDDSYVKYCLEICLKYNVSIFWPSKKMSTIVKNKKKFNEQGVKIICCAESDVLHILNDKALFYNAIANYIHQIPEYYVAKNIQEFDDACEMLQKNNKKICFKPTQSIYGLGFKNIRDNFSDINAFFSSDSISVSLTEARRMLSTVKFFNPLMVMEYLSGNEYSVDCLSQNGRLIRATARKKSKITGGSQSIEFNDSVINIVEKITFKFKLSNIYNVQIRYSEDMPKILEINPRMSGGIYYSCLAGVNYPYWALRLTFEDCESIIPTQKYNINVNQVYTPMQMINSVIVNL